MISSVQNMGCSLPEWSGDKGDKGAMSELFQGHSEQLISSSTLIVMFDFGIETFTSGLPQ